MRQLTNIFLSLVFFIISQSALANSLQKMSNNSNLVENSQMITKFYVLGAGTNVEHMVHNIYKDVLLDRSKRITLFYKDKRSIRQVKEIKSQLLMKGIKDKQISFVENKQTIYPIYAEVEYVLPQKCTYGIAEQRVIYKEYEPCAINHNLKISLKY